MCCHIHHYWHMTINRETALSKLYIQYSSITNHNSKIQYHTLLVLSGLDTED